MTVTHLWLNSSMVELDTCNVVSCNVSDLNAELADLKADGGLAALNNKEEEEVEREGQGHPPWQVHQGDVGVGRPDEIPAGRGETWRRGTLSTRALWRA